MEKITLTKWDIQNHLKTDRDIIGYLAAAFEGGDENHIKGAIADVAKAKKKMASLAKKAGVTREGLYVSLSNKGNPSFGTIKNVLDNLGIQLTVKLKKAT